MVVFFQRGLALLAITILASHLGASTAWAQQETAEQPLATALDRRANLSFERAHLQDVADFLRRDFKIDIRLDDRALVAASVQPDKALVLRGHKVRMQRAAEQLAATLASSNVQVPANADLLQQIRDLPYPGLTFRLPDVTLRSGLYHMLADIDPPLTFATQHGVLWITTPDAAKEKMEVRVYPIGVDLVEATATPAADANSPFEAIPQADESAQFDYEPIIEIVQKAIHPASWDEEGGNGAVNASDGALTVTQTSHNHELVAGLLTALRKARAGMQKPQPNYAAVPVTESEAAAEREVAILNALGQPAAFDYQKMPLTDVAADLSKRFAIAVRLDRKALNAIGVHPKSPVTYQQQNVSLRTGLEMLLNQIDPTLSYSIDHEVLLITTKETAAERPRIVLYPVRDLVSASVTAADALKRPDLWDFDPLIENIQKNLAPDSWDHSGGPGMITADYQGGVLVISQSDVIHHQIGHLLADLRKIAASRPKPDKVQPAVKKEADPFLTVVYSLYQPYHEKAVIKEEDLMKVVRETVAPQSWNAPEVQVRTLPSRLIIRQRTSVHRQIYAALVSLKVLKPEEPTLTPGMGGFGGGGFGGGAFGGGLGAGGGRPPSNSGSPPSGETNGGFRGAGTLPAADE